MSAPSSHLHVIIYYHLFLLTKYSVIIFRFLPLLQWPHDDNHDSDGQPKYVFLYIIYFY